MTFKLIKFDKLLNELNQKKPLEENLSKIIRDIEAEFNFQSLGIFLKVQKTGVYRLKIGRNLSHSFAKNTKYTKEDSLIKELVELLNLKSSAKYKFEKDYFHLIIVPLNFKDQILGFLFIDKESNFFDSEEITKIRMYASIISMVVQIFMQNEEIEQHKGLYENTRIYSYKPFISRAEVIFSMMKRYKRCLTVAVMKIDNLKDIVRTIGEHETHDLMKQIAYIIKNDLRETDIIGKTHQDAFLIIMPETSEKNGLVSITRINNKIADLPIMKVCNTGWGIASSNEKIKTIEELIKITENAAYDSTRKTEGNITIYRE